jgi:hypothetical protein
MGTTEPSIGSRLAGVGLTTLTGIAFAFAGFMGVVIGDGPSDMPVYHPGWMLLGTIPFLALYLLVELMVAPAAFLRAPRAHIAFVCWMAIGACIVGAIEHAHPGECCSDPKISNLIVTISIAWPSAFGAAILIGLFIMVTKSKPRTVGSEITVNSKNLTENEN